VRLFSVLYGDSADTSVDHGREPEFFRDLNLDHVVSAITGGRQTYDLAPYFFDPLGGVDAIEYRQDVFRDLDQPDVHQLISEFVTQDLVAKFRYRVKDLQDDDLGLNHYYRERFFLNAVQQYCDAIIGLATGLTRSTLRSRGLLGLRDYLTGHADSDAFVRMHREMCRLADELDAVRYSLWIKDDRIVVGAYDGETDYGLQVIETFDRFRQRDVAGNAPSFREGESYAATGVLSLVAKLYPELFAALDRFCARYLDYLDPTVGAFDREVRFYLSYLDYIAPLREAGLPISYPQMSSADKNEQARDTFDLALAIQLNRRAATVVANDITLRAAERILVVTGPNNGGKTTLARTFGQLHYLARLGCPVPGRDVRLFACDQIFTHFEREETIGTLEGKLHSELRRLASDLAAATPNSVIILNEMFNSTTAHDALFLSQQILQRVTALDALCVCVTFLDELASLNTKTVSMVSTVRADDPAERTYKLVRKPADGRAYAQAIADKYGLSFGRLVTEITS
jgi:ABC-type molybdenum transport system ATPase subunit/photorepair protein PhrA